MSDPAHGRQPAAPSWIGHPSRRNIARFIFAGLFLLLPGAVDWSLAQEPTNSSAPAATLDFAPPPIDPAFARALAVVKKISGLRETNPGVVFPVWTPGLGMLVGFRTDHGDKQFVHLVEVTTLQPVEKDARGRTVALPVDKCSFTFTWTNQTQVSPRTYKFSTPKYPVRVRLFDANGQFLKESREHLSRGFLTNGLVEVCDIIRGANQFGATFINRTGARAMPTSDWRAQTEIRAARGGLALGGLFAVIGDTDALDLVRKHASAVVRPPNFLKALFELKLDLHLDPKFDQATNLPARGEASSSHRVHFPLSLRQGQRILTTVDFIAGSTEGAWFLTSGVRALRATHPTKPDRRMLAQVLAVGTLSEPVASATTSHTR